MRVSDSMQFEQVKTQVSKNRSEMAHLQNQAATQKRVTKPSDDPMASARVLAVKTDLNSTEQFMKSLQYAKGFMEYSDQSLSELSEVMVRAKEIGVGMANDASASPTARKMAAAEVGQLFDQVVRIGNRKYGDRFLFGGFKTTNKPFDLDGNYKGDNGEMKVQVNKHDFMGVNIPGNMVFMGEGLARDGSPRSTELMPETAADIQNLQMSQTEQPSGVNEEKPLDFRGPAATKSGQEPSKINDSLSTSGVNLFTILRDLEVALRVNDKRGIQETLEPLDEALSQVVFSRSQMGARSMALNRTMETLQKSKVEGNVLKTTLEDIDTYALVSDINRTENGLQATLATSGRLIQPSLIDFLR